MRARRRKHLPRPETLDGILDRAGESRFAKIRAPIPRETWVRAVGARIADRTRPLRLEGGELLVLVATSVWSSELTMLSTEVLARLNSAGVPALRLRFRVGSVEIDRPPERRARRKVPAAVALPPALERVVQALDDSELMGVIRRAAEANLAWQTGRDRGVSPAETAPVAPTLPAFARENDPPVQATPSDLGSASRSRADGPNRRR